MPKIRILYEISEGVFRLLKRNVMGKNVFIDKNLKLALTDKNGLDVKPIMFQDLSRWSNILPIKIWNYIPLYFASYKDRCVQEFGTKVVEGKMNMQLYKEMSEEDSLHELLKKDKPLIENIILLAIAGSLGFFLGYFIFSGGLNQISSII